MVTPVAPSKFILQRTTKPISQGDYLQWGNEQFDHETVGNLYEQSKAFLSG